MRRPAKVKVLGGSALAPAAEQPVADASADSSAGSDAVQINPEGCGAALLTD